jgi:leucyl aminopeptidase
MDITAKTGDPLKQKTPCLVLGLFEGKPLPAALRPLDQLLEGSLSRLLREKEFTGRHRESLLFPTSGRLPAERLLLLGLGKEKGAGLERLRQAAGSLVSVLGARSLTAFATDLPALPLKGTGFSERCQALTEALLLAAYRFDRFRTLGREEFPPPLESVRLLVADAGERRSAEQAIADGVAIAAGVILARNLVNEPGNVKSPEFLADQARLLAAAEGLRCTVLDRAALEAEGLGALLGVAQGSVREARLILLEYQGGNSDARPIALVGKGVVFDAGGISLKPAEKMDEMKMDMAGGAAVLGTFCAAARLKLPVNLVGLIPAVENLPSGSAIRPGDILTSLSGKTIEVLNTDAEGRLILADALTYAKRYNPRVVIDLATLTGACIIALGHCASAVLGNHEGLIRQLLRAGEQSGERLWQLPLWDDYAAQIKSEVADVKNTGGRPAGTITAAAFLQKFAGDYTWAHLDIAGTAWEEKGQPCTPKGGTGVGVRLLVQYLRQGTAVQR